MATVPTAPAPVTETPPTSDDTGRAFVIELAFGQTPDALALAAAPPERITLTEPLFPGVDPADDPERLAALHRVVITGSDPSIKDWDAAYLIADRGGYVTVEPDRDDALLPETARSAMCFDEIVAPQAQDASWSLRAMKVAEARLRPVPWGGKALGEGIRICHPDSGWTHHVDLDVTSLDLNDDLDLVDGDDDALDPLGYLGNPGHGTATGSVLISDGGIGSASGTTPPGLVSGLAPKATLVPIRAVRSVIQAFDSDVARAVRHSVTAQCDVVSMSLGGRAFFGLERAIRDAVAHDVIVVAAAGNCVGFVVAPAIYDESIAVAATNVAGNPWRGSSRGRAVDISAPGEDVHVARAAAGTTPAVEVSPGEGTSFATASVAGAAAVWLAFHGEAAIDEARGPLSRRDLYLAALQSSASRPAPPASPWVPTKFGAGIVNLDALLAYRLDAPRTAPESPRDDPVALLARMFDREPAQVRQALSALLNEPANLDESLAKVGGELLDLAARDPSAMDELLDASDAGQPRSPARVAAEEGVAREASSTLAALMLPATQ